MTYWSDIACIVLVCVTANHLGLVKAIEEVAHRELKIVNCPKCLTCWSVLAYSLITSRSPITSLAISLLASYTSLWLELFELFIDTLYMKLYEKISTEPGNDTAATGPKRDNFSGTVPKLQENCKNSN